MHGVPIQPVCVMRIGLKTPKMYAVFIIIIIVICRMSSRALFSLSSFSLHRQSSPTSVWLGPPVNKHRRRHQQYASVWLRPPGKCHHCHHCHHCHSHCHNYHHCHRSKFRLKSDCHFIDNHHHLHPCGSGLRSVVHICFVVWLRANGFAER